MITFRRLITYLSINAAIRVGITMVRVKENLMHRIRNSGEMEDRNVM